MERCTSLSWPTTENTYYSTHDEDKSEDCKFKEIHNVTTEDGFHVVAYHGWTMNRTEKRTKEQLKEYALRFIRYTTKYRDDAKSYYGIVCNNNITQSILNELVKPAVTISNEIKDICSPIQYRLALISLLDALWD